MYFSRTRQNHILQLLQKHGCWIGLPADQIFHLKHIWQVTNTLKMTTNSSAAGNLYQARMGPNSNTKTPETRCPDVSKLFWIEEMIHHGKHAPVPTTLSSVAGMKFEMSSFCAYVVPTESVYMILWTFMNSFIYLYSSFSMNNPRDYLKREDRV